MYIYVFDLFLSIQDSFVVSIIIMSYIYINIHNNTKSLLHMFWFWFCIDRGRGRIRDALPVRELVGELTVCYQRRIEYNSYFYGFQQNAFPHISLHNKILGIFRIILFHQNKHKLSSINWEMSMWETLLYRRGGGERVQNKERNTTMTSCWWGGGRMEEGTRKIKKNNWSMWGGRAIFKVVKIVTGPRSGVVPVWGWNTTTSLFGNTPWTGGL